MPKRRHAPSSPRPGPRPAAIALALLTAAAAAQPAPEPPAGPDHPQVQWARVEGKSIELRLDDETLWRFNFDPRNTHNYFHPLSLPGVGDLTLDAPGDHVHHHGLWFSWKYINGVNFWEHAPGGDRPAGRTAWLPPVVELRKDGAADVLLAVSYSIEERRVLGEIREIRVSAPAPDGAYTIDWRSEFHADADTVSLDRTPLPGEPGGQVYGGYAGLSARLSQWERREAITPDGPAEFNADDRFRARSDAFEYAGTLGGREVGIAILSDPRNLNSPSPWYAIRTDVMSFFTPAVLCYGPHELHRDEAFTLRYRVIVHPGRWTRDELASAAETYRNDLNDRQTPQEPGADDD